MRRTESDRAKMGPTSVRVCVPLTCLPELLDGVAAVPERGGVEAGCLQVLGVIAQTLHGTQRPAGQHDSCGAHNNQTRVCEPQW